MVFLKHQLTKKEFKDLQNQGSQAIKDYGFYYLYNNGYIKTDKEYTGALLKEKDGEYGIICGTIPYEESKRIYY